ncbi:Structure-specific endonuclease subunit slx1 [Penicillium macrosclerotiorum]|uniref:Structure-specific endonuclease subunit slx1 n=1 Tax=Penicillium macrosclerotiorum TaxID=303699 RepID=UPI00254774BB|nr:Structure-specific endonuclease subunit slx1 [Penicillium macrosclerotiorum]KAJ5689300.1 Structure-specific endonuclease subunit slx1 [Penicillium macrosclerotiorum]
MDGQEEPKPIPAYYCCYLLRSTVRHASLYIGSTPNPIRRLSQHNGGAKGGAKRTSRDNLRPWEMVLVVEGFTSRVGALQFEWAWQNPDQSRHLDWNDVEAHSDPLSSSRTGKPKSRSRRSLKAHLEDVHSLLRSTYFVSWPLRIRFFRADVNRVWRVWNDRVDVPLPETKIILDGDCPKQSDTTMAVGSINQLPLDYAKLEDYLEKSMFLLDDPEDLRCQVCKAPVIPTAEQIVVCPQSRCQGTNHLLCLSARFLKATNDLNCLVPAGGVCPTCEKYVSWPLMMQELSVRNRAQKECRAILRKKERRERKETGAVSSVKTNNTSNSSKRNAVSTRQTSVEPTQGGPSGLTEHAMSPLVREDPLLDDNWHEAIDLESDSEHGVHPPIRSPSTPPRLEIVIEDSEWDDAELIE